MELALAGDTVALRLCLERLLPPRRERPVRFALPRLESAADAIAATAAITRAVAAGELTPGEAAELRRLLGGYLEAVEAVEFEQRLRRWEQHAEGGR